MSNAITSSQGMNQPYEVKEGALGADKVNDADARIKGDSVGGAFSQITSKNFTEILCALIRTNTPDKPLEPLEIVRSVTEMTQTASVQEMRNVMEQMMDKQNLAHLLEVSNQVGNIVEVKSHNFTFNPDKKSELIYDLPKKADDVTVQVYDSKNQLVAILNSDGKDIGKHSVEWDGTQFNGQKAESGSYRFKVNAKDEKGIALKNDAGGYLKINHSIKGRVIGGSLNNDSKPILNIDGVEVPLDSMIGIRRGEEIVVNNQVPSDELRDLLRQTVQEMNVIPEAQQVVQQQQRRMPMPGVIGY